MDKVRLGRRLGIGTRLAAKALRKQAQKATSSEVASVHESAAKRQPRQEQNAAPAAARPVIAHSAVSRKVVRQAARGGRGFGRGFWGPFAHAGRALWHEVTGVFFALFALFFAQGVWRFRESWRSGPQHWYFAGSLVITVLFVYFSVSAFIHSRRAPR